FGRCRGTWWPTSWAKMTSISSGLNCSRRGSPSRTRRVRPRPARAALALRVSALRGSRATPATVSPVPSASPRTRSRRAGAAQGAGVARGWTLGKEGKKTPGRGRAEEGRQDHPPARGPPPPPPPAVPEQSVQPTDQAQAQRAAEQPALNLPPDPGPQRLVA